MMKNFLKQTQSKFWFWICFLTLLALSISGFHSEIKINGLAILLSLLYFSRGLWASLFYLLAMTPFFAAFSLSSIASILFPYSIGLVIFDLFFTDFNLNIRQQSLFLISCLFVFDFVFVQWRLLFSLESFFWFQGDFFSWLLTLLVGALLIPYFLNKPFTAHHAKPHIEQLDLFTHWGKKRQKPFSF